METNVEQKIQIKSAEQRMIERATAEYISKLRAVLGNKAAAAITINGVPLSKLGTIAEFLTDEEGESVPVKVYKSGFMKTKNYIHHSIKGDGYEIEEISE